LSSLTQLQEVPPENVIFLVGLPGSGKSTFCHQAVLRNIETRPVIYVTTESTPSKVEDSLRQKGLGRLLPHPLVFVDAFMRPWDSQPRLDKTPWTLPLET